MVNPKKMVLSLVAGVALVLTSYIPTVNAADGAHLHSKRTDHVYYEGELRSTGGEDDRHSGRYDDAEYSRHSGRYVHEDYNHGKIDTGLILVNKKVPESAGFHENYMMEMEVKALENVRDVEIKTDIPEGADFVRAEPPAQMMGNQLMWKFDKMKHGEVEDIKVWFKPMREGDLSSCTSAHAVPLACVLTHVGRPEIQIMKDGPEMVNLGDSVTYRIEVKNTGTIDANDVVVTDREPDGLKAHNGEAMYTFNAGDLHPGESKHFNVTYDTLRKGRVCNTADAESSNAGRVSDNACTNVVVKDLEISKTGRAMQFIGKEADYTIRVTNTGDLALKNVRVEDMAPSGTSIVSADGADISGNRATWMIDELAAGQSKSFNITLRGNQLGERCNSASASAEGMSENADYCTEWKGRPAILLEVVDDNDPLEIGESTRYHIRVTNQGNADDHNIRIAARFTGELKPMNAQGATDGNVSGQTVIFAPYGKLAPKQSIDFYINAEAMRVGDGRIRLELDSEALDRPVFEEESTHVY